VYTQSLLQQQHLQIELRAFAFYFHHHRRVRRSSKTTDHTCFSNTGVLNQPHILILNVFGEFFYIHPSGSVSDGLWMVFA